VFDDLLDAVFQLCCDVSIVAFFAAAVGLGAVRTDGGGDESLLARGLPGAEEGVGRLAGVSLQGVDLGVRDLDASEIPFGDLDVAWVRLTDVDRYWSRTWVGAWRGLEGGVLRGLVGGVIELVVRDGVVVVGLPASGLALWRSVWVDSR
jgi:hypothetical protein